MSSVIKLSSRHTRQFWEIPVLFEDEHLLALGKPAGLLTSPDRNDPSRPCLMRLLHDSIAGGKSWVADRGLSYLMNAHRLDAEVSGILLLARTKPMLTALVNLFGTHKPQRQYVALADGVPKKDHFEVDAKLAPHPAQPGLVRVDLKAGKRARTVFEVVERFGHGVLLKCLPQTERPNQIRVHLRRAGLRLFGDALYGGRPLWLSRLKAGYRLKEGKTERPLISLPALHAEQLTLPHPVSGELLTLTAPWPKDLKVAVKYLRQYSADREMNNPVSDRATANVGCQ